MTMAGPPLKVSSDYITWLLTTNRGIMAHLYQFTSATGIEAYYTDFDLSVSWNDQVWQANSLRFEGLQRKLNVGLAVDEQTLKIWAAPTDTMFGANFLENAENGLLDGAVIVRYRAIWPFVTGTVSNDVQLAPLAVWPLFTGYTSQISKGGASHVELKVKSALLRLNVNMPRNYFQPGCNWTLFDAGCTLSKAAFAKTGTLTTPITPTQLPISGGISPVNGPDGFTYYASGRLLFTSGVNTGLQILIDTNDASNIYPAYPLTSLPSAGDTVNYYPGCSKAFTTCDLKFNNKNNFRGFDKVPPIHVSI